MFDKILAYFEILTDNPLYIVIALMAVFVTGGIVYLYLMRKPRPQQVTLPIRKMATITQGPTEIKVLLGTGMIACIAIRHPTLLGYDPDINILDFTTMPEPLGEIHFADTSCPVSGGIYTVRENEDGSLVDYDPRQVPLDVETTPERAYQTTHWSELPMVWGTPKPFYKNPSFWFAIGCLVITFFVTMVAMGA